MSDKNLPAYQSFSSENRTDFFKTYNNEKIGGFVSHGSSAANERVTDLRNRPPYSREDYDLERPNEQRPHAFKGVVRACRSAYYNTGIVRNVFDVMIDFVISGLHLVSSDPKSKQFYKKWAEKIKLMTVGEEFAKHLLIESNVVVKRVTSRIKNKSGEHWISTNADVRLPKDKGERGVIPIRYLFLDITALDWVGGSIAQMNNVKQLQFNIPSGIISEFKNKIDSLDQSEIPSDFRKAIEGNSRKFNLDMSKIYVDHIKKDTWQQWAYPPLMSVLSDIDYKRKLRLAELSALDGIINVIRLWKLGDHKEGILPDETAINKLINILEANVGGGALDIVWDSMIEMQEFYPPVDKILGSEKYQQVIFDILVGLGLPEVLIGGKGANFSNAWIQLQTIVEKLKIVRSKLKDFLNAEFALIEKNTGIKAPSVRFRINLQDESVAKKLLISLFDRNVISGEALLDFFEEDYDLEVNRLESQKATLKEKGIKYNSPLDKDSKAKGEIGRPTGSKDEGGRKMREAKVRTSGSSDDFKSFASSAIEAVDKHFIPAYLSIIGKSDPRKLTNAEKDELSQNRLIALSCIKYGSDLNKEAIIDLVANADQNYNHLVYKIIESGINSFSAKLGRKPSAAERKVLEALYLSKAYGDLS